MKILIDVTSLGTARLTGIGVYIRNLIARLGESPGLEVHGSYYAEKFRTLPAIRSHVSVPLTPYVHVVSGLNLRRYDVFHGPDFRIPYSRLYPKVVTVHDIVDYETTIVDGERSARNTRRFEHMLFTDRPASIIADSHFIRDQLVLRFPELEPVTGVVYPGADHIADEAPEAGSPRPAGGPYLLFVGNVERRKNIPAAIRAFDRAKSVLPDLRFVIVGQNGYRHDETDEAIRRSPHAGHIQRKMFVTGEELVRLYRHAELLLFPTLYEGFGFPVLEAMRLGCPVITSDTGAPKEISGGAAVLVSPSDTEQTARAILAVCEDSSLRERLVRAGRERSGTFTWKRCADETIEVYRTTMR